MNEHPHKCDGCGHWRYDVTWYFPDDTCAVWNLCVPCRTLATPLCDEYRTSQQRVDHRRVLGALGRKDLSSGRAFPNSRPCPLCGGSGQFSL